MLTHSSSLFAIGLPSPEICLVLTVVVCMVAIAAGLLILATFIGRRN